VSSQGIAYWEKRLSDSKEIERLEKKAKAESDAHWRLQNYMASQMPNNSGRIIDWRRM
jgi:hypothetical protein